jgi:hypothetical protein
MAGSLSNYTEDAILNAIFRNGTFPITGTTIYFSLFTAAPSDAGGGTEVTGGSYARVAVLRNVTTNFDAPADNAGSQQTANTNAITFPSPTANWGTVTHMGVHDAASAGNLIAWADLTTSRVINNGDGAPSFAIGAFTTAVS